jgi:hypothetical protein
MVVAMMTTSTSTVVSTLLVRLLREPEMTERRALDLLERYVAMRLHAIADEMMRAAYEEVVARDHPAGGTRIN